MWLNPQAQGGVIERGCSLPPAWNTRRTWFSGHRALSVFLLPRGHSSLSFMCSSCSSQPPHPGACRAQRLGLFSICPTRPVVSFSPSGSQSPTDDSQNFCLQLDVLSELQTHRSKCLLTRSTVCLIDMSKTDTLILSHPKICPSVKSFPFQWLTTQLFQ